MDTDTELEKGKILLVDDDEDFRRILRRYLERFHYRVEEAENGEQALAFVRAGGISLVLLDIVLREESGWVVLRSLRHAGAERVLLMTGGCGGPETERDARLLGACGVLLKPFSLQQLSAAVLEASRRKLV